MPALREDSEVSVAQVRFQQNGGQDRVAGADTNPKDKQDSPGKNLLYLRPFDFILGHQIPFDCRQLGR
jgi:hypothetical protein